ncbi:sporulation phosphorelay system protein KapB [Lentibacillus sp.]|uniref:sporulation phosphorelay system protein KapB n=1 Tax=Lentibacillus sp. TaxID=1925746 RepID=UPI002B4B797E|nr:sporulation phosphorelay system protein KapB [Lentibacillus sp.]HLS09677.1 sporulation phosphorelay system protein KapB [Lentibacillus sp.]
MAVSVGDIVEVKYNSGRYIGEVLEDRGERFLVKVHAVTKHPMQGDLHHPGETEGVLFQERKALAHYEKMNVVKSAVKGYDGELPDYRESLQKAIADIKEQLSKKDTAFNQQSLKQVEDLEQNTYTKSYYK